MSHGARLRLPLLLLALVFTSACHSLPFSALNSKDKSAALASNGAMAANSKTESAPRDSAISLANYESSAPNASSGASLTEKPLQRPLPQGGEVAHLELPPLEAGDIRFPINLAAALRLADARPLVIAAAQASAWQAEAKMQQANVLWLPDFYWGFDYTRHDGYGPDLLNATNVPPGVNAQGQPNPASFGKSLQQDVNMMYAGGAFYSMTYLTDIIYEPLKARQHLNGKRWDIQQAKNDALLKTAQAYFDVHKYRGQYAVRST